MKKIFFLIAFVIFLILPNKADAILLSVDDSVFGVGAITKDTSTGLEWLDLTLSLGRSYNDIVGLDGSNEFLSGGDFAGFRYANRSELTNLWADAEIPFFPGPERVENFSPVSTLGALVGITRTDSFTIESIGVFGEEAFSNFHFVGHLNVKPLANIASASMNAAGDDSIGFTKTGNWLIRESSININTVPEPASMFLFGSGFVGVFLRKRRAQNIDYWKTV